MAIGASAIYILDAKGKILISRNYRGDVPMSCAERFIARLTEQEELNVKPVFEEDGITYIYIKLNDIYMLATTSHNANAAMILMFLYRAANVGQAFLFCSHFRSYPLDVGVQGVLQET